MGSVLIFRPKPGNPAIFERQHHKPCDIAENLQFGAKFEQQSLYAIVFSLGCWLELENWSISMYIKTVEMCPFSRGKKLITNLDKTVANKQV